MIVNHEKELFSYDEIHLVLNKRNIIRWAVKLNFENGYDISAFICYNLKFSRIFKWLHIQAA